MFDHSREAFKNWPVIGYPAKADDLGLEASCHAGAKAFPARAANDCSLLPPRDVPCDTALPDRPSSSCGWHNLSGEVNVYNAYNLLRRLIGLLTQCGLQQSHQVQRRPASHGSIFGSRIHDVVSLASRECVVLQINRFICLMCLMCVVCVQQIKLRFDVVCPKLSKLQVPKSCGANRWRNAEVESQQATSGRHDVTVNG